MRRYVVCNEVAGQQQYWMQVNGETDTPVTLPTQMSPPPPPVPVDQQAGWAHRRSGRFGKTEESRRPAGNTGHPL